MSLKIEIVLPDEGGISRRSLDDHMEALGFSRGSLSSITPATPASQEAAQAIIRGDEPEQIAAQSATDTAKRTRKKKDDTTNVQETAEPSTIVTNTPRVGEPDDPRQQISTSPENRIGPEDDADTQAQDAADEQAEVEASREPEKKYTLDDVRASMSRYVERFDLAAAQADGINLLKDTLGEPPEGENFWKASLIPQDKYGLVIDAWNRAAASDTRYK